MQVKITNYGAIVTSILVPDRNGKLGDITLGYDRVEDYINAVDKPYFGAIVGRYGNRIAKGEFVIDGETYSLATNNSPNHLHGGVVGFDKVVWELSSSVARVGQGWSELPPRTKKKATRAIFQQGDLQTHRCQRIDRGLSGNHR